MNLKKKSIYIIGTGRTGSAFAFELNGAEYSVDFLTERNEDRLKQIADKVHVVSSSAIIEKSFIESADIMLICVQDRYIKQVLEDIMSTGASIKDKIFFHTSGALSTDIFPEAYNSELIASVHPIQTFDKLSFENNGLLKKIYFGIEGKAEGLKAAEHIVTALDSSYIIIPKDKKILYHSACVVSSNFLVTLINIASEIMGSIGVEKSRTFEIFRPIIERTLSNIGHDGLVKSLTGPFDRNDIDTISKHLDSINKELPSLIPFYTLLGMETVKVAFRKESLNMKNVISILDLMNEYIIKEQKRSQTESKQ